MGSPWGFESASSNPSVSVPSLPQNGAAGRRATADSAIKLCSSEDNDAGTKRADECSWPWGSRERETEVAERIAAIRQRMDGKVRGLVGPYCVVYVRRGQQRIHKCA